MTRPLEGRKRNDRRDPRTGIETDEHASVTAHYGTREALIAAGLATTGQFPGEPGCGKTSTVFPAKNGERRKQVRRCSSRIYEVRIDKTPEERAAYQAEFEAFIMQEQSARERERYTRALGCDGIEGLRRLAQDNLMRGGLLIETAFNLQDSPDIPYRFDKEVRAEAVRAIWTLVQLMRKPLRVRAGALAGGDAAFQRFLGTTLNGRGDGACPS